MNCLQRLLVTILTAFSALSAYALYQHGVCDFLHLAVATPANLTLSADLVIALTLVSAWLWRDARSRGKSPWPFLVLTALLGSVGPLLYLVLKSGKGDASCCGGDLAK